MDQIIFEKAGRSGPDEFLAGIAKPKLPNRVYSRDARSQADGLRASKKVEMGEPAGRAIQNFAQIAIPEPMAANGRNVYQ